MSPLVMAALAAHGAKRSQVEEGQVPVEVRVVTVPRGQPMMKGAATAAGAAHIRAATVGREERRAVGEAVWVPGVPSASAGQELGESAGSILLHRA